MKPYKIIESEKNISPDDLNNFENNYNIKLPENYKRLLLKYNGGITNDDDLIVSQLLSLKYGECTIEEWRDLQLSENTAPLEFLLIAETGTGNVLGILLSDENLGKIYLFTEDDFQLYANSLEELLGVESIDEL